MSMWALLATGLGIQAIAFLSLKRWVSLKNRTLLPIGFSIVFIAIVSAIVPNLPTVYSLIISGLAATMFSYIGTARFNTYYTVLQSVFLVLFGFNAIASPLVRACLPQGLVGMGLYIGIMIGILICEFYFFIIVSELISKRINHDTE